MFKWLVGLVFLFITVTSSYSYEMEYNNACHGEKECIVKLCIADYSDGAYCETVTKNELQAYGDKFAKEEHFLTEKLKTCLRELDPDGFLCTAKTAGVYYQSGDFDVEEIRDHVILKSPLVKRKLNSDYIAYKADDVRRHLSNNMSDDEATLVCAAGISFLLTYSQNNIEAVEDDSNVLWAIESCKEGKNNVKFKDKRIRQ